MNLLISNQFGFNPGDLCINQLLSIAYGIYRSFYEGFEIDRNFLHISRAFDNAFKGGSFSSYKRMEW